MKDEAEIDDFGRVTKEGFYCDCNCICGAVRAPCSHCTDHYYLLDENVFGEIGMLEQDMASLDAKIEELKKQISSLEKEKQELLDITDILSSKKPGVLVASRKINGLNALIISQGNVNSSVIVVSEGGLTQFTHFPNLHYENFILVTGKDISDLHNRKTGNV